MILHNLPSLLCFFRIFLALPAWFLLFMWNSEWVGLVFCFFFKGLLIFSLGLILECWVFCTFSANLFPGFFFLGYLKKCIISIICSIHQLPQKKKNYKLLLIIKTSFKLLIYLDEVKNSKIQQCYGNPINRG